MHYLKHTYIYISSIYIIIIVNTFIVVNMPGYSLIVMFILLSSVQQYPSHYIILQQLLYIRVWKYIMQHNMFHVQ